MSSWTIGRRIGSGYGVLLALLAVIGVVGAYALVSTRDTYRSAVRAQEEGAIKALEAEYASSTANNSFLRFFITGEQRYFNDYTTQARQARANFDALKSGTTSPEQRSGWTEAERFFDERAAVIQSIIADKRAGKDAEAMRLYNEQLIPLTQQVRGKISELVQAEEARGQQLSASAASDASTALWALGIVGVLALAAGLAIAWTLSRSITTRLRAAVGTLAGAATEILTATTQQAAGATEEETAVHQTTVTVDEVRQTVQVASDKAKAVADAVRRTADVSQEGRRAVDETVKGAREAKQRMETIAERILALSEQSQAIAEITSSVNDLAEQSNLLAVNASIEAAKAGEAGRGFAVVAAEVKALAEQSKQATGQIHAILNEIQRATQAAVMAAEQGVKASDAGEAVASEAGEAIRVLSEGMTESAQAAQQIIISAQQQLTGVEQVAQAMENIQQASAQNMASTRQVEEAAQNLNELARGLSALVEASRSNGRGLLR